jgi:hypothetical protein
VVENSSAEAVPPGVDTSVANSARVWNYWLGGKDNYGADRETGDHVLLATVGRRRALRRYCDRRV